MIAFWSATGKRGTHSASGQAATEEAAHDASGTATGARRWRLADGRTVEE